MEESKYTCPICQGNFDISGLKIHVSRRHKDRINTDIIANMFKEIEGNVKPEVKTKVKSEVKTKVAEPVKEEPVVIETPISNKKSGKGEKNEK